VPLPSGVASRATSQFQSRPGQARPTGIGWFRPSLRPEFSVVAAISCRQGARRFFVLFDLLGQFLGALRSSFFAWSIIFWTLFFLTLDDLVQTLF
jgi:hypothetical protein